MSIESECKYIGADLKKTANLLRKLGATCFGMHFERNLIFDTIDKELYNQQKLLRLRSQQWAGKSKSKLTLKLPLNGEESKKCKIKEELELEISDFGLMAAVLENLGYRQIAVYEKFRESWQLIYQDNAKNDKIKVKIDLDILPFCHTVEIEAPCESIHSVAAILELDKEIESVKNYHELNQEWRKKNGLPLSLDFVFTDVEKTRLKTAFGLNF